MTFDPIVEETTSVAAVGGEVTLFRAVIARAFRDALNCSAVNGGLAESEARKALSLREEAREWLLSDTDDFIRVCELALVEPEAVRSSARRAIESRDGKDLRIAA